MMGMLEAGISGYSLNGLPSTGSIFLWFLRDWDSTNLGGASPGDWPNLLSLGQRGTNGSSWQAWYRSPDGCTIYFPFQTNGGTASNDLAAVVAKKMSYFGFGVHL